MEKNFDEWNDMKKELNDFEVHDYIHERQVWWCALGVNIGIEQDGKNDLFERPVLVLLKFNKDSALVIPFTSQHKVGRYYLPVTHQGQELILILSQIRLISTKRLLRKMYQMQIEIFEKVQQSVCDMILKRLPLAQEPREPEGHIEDSLSSPPDL